MNNVKSLMGIGLIAVLAACSKPEVISTEQPAARPAKIVTAVDAIGAQMRKFPITVEATKDADLSFRVSGENLKYHVLPGQQVEAGQLLVEIDPKDYLLQQQQAEATYELSVSQFERSKQLKDKNLISNSEFDQSKAELKIARANLNTARLNVTYTKLKAPFKGSIAKVYAENFESIQAKQPVVELQTTDLIDVAVQMPESIVVQVDKVSESTKTYQPIVRFDANPELSFKASLKEYDIAPDPLTKTYKVVFSLKAPEELNILPGMTGIMEVELGKIMNQSFGKAMVPVGALFIPNEKAAEGKQYVLKVDENLVTHLVPVEVAQITQKGAVIENGIEVGDRVIAAGVHAIPDGTKVLEWQRESGL